MYPNPVVDEINILFPSDVQQYYVSIITSQGKVVIGQIKTSTNPTSINLSGIAPGVYTNKMVETDGDSVHYEKFIIAE